MNKFHFIVGFLSIFGYMFELSNESEVKTENRKSYRWREKRSQVSKGSGGSPTEFCDLKSCKKTASKMLLQMNHEADPCEEFYNFACGEGLDLISDTRNLEHILDYMKINTNTSEIYFQNYITFYKSCSQYNIEFNFRDRVHLNTTQNLTMIDLVLSQAVPFFDIGLDIGYNQSYELQLTIPGASSLKTTTKGWSIIEKFREACLKTYWETNDPNADLNVIYNNIKSCTKQTIKDYMSSYEIHLELFNATNPYTKEMNFFLDKFEDLAPNMNEIKYKQETKHYEPITVTGLTNKYDLINWINLLKGITLNKLLDGDTTVQLYFPEYFDKVFNFLKAYNESYIINIFKEFHNFQFYVNSMLIPKQENREIFCVVMANDLMPDIATIISYDLIRQNTMLHYWNQRTKVLFDELKNTLKQSLENSSIDEYSTKFLQNKLKQITLGLITSGNSNSTKEHYKNIILSSENYQTNLITLIQNYRRIVFSLVGAKSSPATLLTYFVDPFYTKPKAFYTSPYIVFHPEMLLRSNMDLPDYMILASIGIHLAHELAKHFDLIGRNFLVDSGISACNGFYKQLSTQTLTILDMQENLPDLQKWNRELIADNMIVDNAAFRMIVDLFIQQNDLQTLPWISQTYTQEQIFFIIAAQEYCEKTTFVDYRRVLVERGDLPSLLRIHNIVSNSQHFSYAFSCKEGSAMSLDPGLITEFPYMEYIEYDDE